MRRATTIILIAESEHGVFETPTATQRMVFADVLSVGMREFFEAQAAGIEPEIKFGLSDYSEYHGERIVLWNDVRYRVVRTYVSDYKIELTCEKETVT